MDTRHEAWTQRGERRQEASNRFEANREERWNHLDQAREDRQAWRDQNREDWQKHREELWDYRGDRAEEIWDNAQDFYDDIFDDRWWGAWGYGSVGNYPINPWWWWAPAAWGTVSAYVDSIPPEPAYIDYGMNVVYEDQTVYVNNLPIPAEQYTQPMIEMANRVEQPPPPLPPEMPAATQVTPSAPAAGQPGRAQTPPARQPETRPTPPAVQPEQEWLPLGVYVLAQEEKGEPTMFFQISVNRAGLISGAYQSALTDDKRPIAGQVDKSSQRVAWRIGDNSETIFETTLANLTQDVSPIAIHFGPKRTQTWLLVRMPEPPAAGQPQKLPEAPKAPPPLKKN